MLKIIIGIVVFTGGLLYWAYQKESNFQQLCEAKGGKMLRGRDLMVCVDPKVLINVE